MFNKLAFIIFLFVVGGSIGYVVDDYVNLHRRVNALERMTQEVVIDIPDFLFNANNN